MYMQLFEARNIPACVGGKMQEFEYVSLSMEWWRLLSNMLNKMFESYCAFALGELMAFFFKFHLKLKLFYFLCKQKMMKALKKSCFDTKPHWLSTRGVIIWASDWRSSTNSFYDGNCKWRTNGDCTLIINRLLAWGSNFGVRSKKECRWMKIVRVIGKLAWMYTYDVFCYNQKMCRFSGWSWNRVL